MDDIWSITLPKQHIFGYCNLVLVLFKLWCFMQNKPMLTDCGAADRESFEASQQWEALSRLICECSTRLNDAKVSGFCTLVVLQKVSPYNL